MPCEMSCVCVSCRKCVFRWDQHQIQGTPVELVHALYKVAMITWGIKHLESFQLSSCCSVERMNSKTTFILMQVVAASTWPDKTMVNLCTTLRTADNRTVSIVVLGTVMILLGLSPVMLLAVYIARQKQMSGACNQAAFMKSSWQSYNCV